MSKFRGNLDWLFYKDYYRDQNLNVLISARGNISDSEKIEDKNKNLCSYRITNKEIQKRDGNSNKLFKQSFRLKTTYPGLLIGSGLIHGVGADEEFKIGFQFDYTTGLPIIPASSVKGLLRSAFPLETIRYKDEKERYIKDLIAQITSKDVDVKALEKEIFEGVVNGEKISVRDRDTFFAAQIISGNKNNEILGEDFITPHLHPLKDPQPLKFLKVLPNVVFQFRFDLKDSKSLTVIQKKQLFKNIILDLGVGSKTNVGYGNLIDQK